MPHKLAESPQPLSEDDLDRMMAELEAGAGAPEASEEGLLREQDKASSYYASISGYNGGSLSESGARVTVSLDGGPQAAFGITLSTSLVEGGAKGDDDMDSLLKRSSPCHVCTNQTSSNQTSSNP